MYNHYIPQFYTKRWEGERDKKEGLLVTRYSRPYLNVVCDDKPTSSIGGREDLYKIPHLQDGTEHKLETEFFKKIDQNASNAMDKIEKFGISALSGKEREHWSTFIISLRQRTPESLKKLGDRVEIRFKEILVAFKPFYQSKRKSSDPVSFEEFEASYRTIERIAQARIELLQESIELPNSNRTISSFLWKIRANEPQITEFLTSDRPVIIDERYSTEGGYIALPMSPMSIFLASSNISILTENTNRPNLPEIMNDTIVRAAEKEVYGTDNSFKEFVESRLRPSPLSQDIAAKRAARANKRRAFS